MSAAPKEPKPPFTPQHQQAPGLDSKMDPPPRYKGEAYRPADKLKGKAALITGGDSGIGRSVAVLFAREGADVAIVYLPVEQTDAEQVQKDVEALGRKCLLLPGDVKSSRFCDDAVAKTVQAFGRLDVLVNNAAVMPLTKSIEEITDEQIDEVFRTNIFAYIYMARAAAKVMRPGSAIINTGSMAGVDGFAKAIDYAATKAAIHAFTMAFSKQAIKQGIRVNCVAPGPVWTPLNASARPADDMAQYGSENAVGRPAQPEEMAPAYVYLASNADSGWLFGETIKMFPAG
ncbi:MAG: SDR family oxidoreductase [Planctomycetota bacterium]|nr:SDR family oxidoreductase [Planctomycetaceae bacterium]MDQ3329121.1 SDR family oxidoreductase [Planctomycetota bacterium]